MRAPLCIYEEVAAVRGVLWFGAVGSVEVVGSEVIVADKEGDCIGLADVEGLALLGAEA